MVRWGNNEEEWFEYHLETGKEQFLEQGNKQIRGEGIHSSFTYAFKMFAECLAMSQSLRES